MNRFRTLAFVGLLLPAGCLIALGLTTQPSMPGATQSLVPMAINQPIRQNHTESVQTKQVSSTVLPSQTSQQASDCPILKVWREKDASGKWVMKSCNISETGAEIANR